MSKVLLADDSVTIQKVVEFILAESGYDLKIVGTSDAVAPAAGDFHPDVVLVDINMPGMSGYQIAEELRSNPLTSGIPIIMLAGAFEPIDYAMADKAGIVDYLIKPFEADDLLKKVAARLDGGGSPAAAAPVADIIENEFSFADVNTSDDEPVVDESFGDIDTSVGAVEVEAEPMEADVYEADIYEAEVYEEATPISVSGAQMPTSVGVSPESLKEALSSSLDAAMSNIDMSGIIAGAVEARIGDAVASIDVPAIVHEALESTMRDTIERTLMEVIPEIAEVVLRERIEETMNHVRHEIENIIWETVPDLAEAIIKKEIERIRAGK